jgi:hypothetical protein
VPPAAADPSDPYAAADPSYPSDPYAAADPSRPSRASAPYPGPDPSYPASDHYAAADPSRPSYPSAPYAAADPAAGSSATPDPYDPSSVPSMPLGGPAPYASPLSPASASYGGADHPAACPNCAAPLDSGSRFCEVCGYDPSTGSLPQAPVLRPAEPVAPALAYTAPPTGVSGSMASRPSAVGDGTGSGAAPYVATRVVAVITADRAYYDSHDVSDVPFPLGVPARTIELPAGPVGIGRRSRSRGTSPEIDLAGPPEDPAVSHTHASLLPNDDGTWQLIDHGSTNGTFLNEEPEPVPANVPLPVVAGDRVYLGAWTRITLEVRSG